MYLKIGKNFSRICVLIWFVTTACVCLEISYIFKLWCIWLPSFCFLLTIHKTVGFPIGLSKSENQEHVCLVLVGEIYIDHEAGH